MLAHPLQQWSVSETHSQELPHGRALTKGCPEFQFCAKR